MRSVEKILGLEHPDFVHSLKTVAKVYLAKEKRPTEAIRSIRSWVG